MLKYPTGAITLVFTDIQGSTELWGQMGSDFQAVLQDHNRLIRHQIEAHRGHEVKTEGDAFMIAFHRARDAVQFALKAQESLHQHRWPESAGEILVRMGIHTGEPLVEFDQNKKQVDYFGPMVNLAARISDAAHGGQILISGVTHQSSEAELPDVKIESLGEHRFKGIEEAERLYQVVPGMLEDRSFPPPRTIDVRKTNLSKNPSSFFGRKKEIKRLTALLGDESTRLVTITGFGGTGKTRLAQAWASTSIHEYPAGVWFVDITEARNRDDVCRLLASTLNVPLNSDDPVEQLGNSLHGMTRSSDGEVLLLIDNCEQVIDDAAELLRRWLQMAPKAKFLTTSRFLLNVKGEQELALEQLNAPSDEELEKQDNHQLESFSAVQLFIKRSREANPRFEVDDDNIQDIARICRKLDGIPLAIELAASRIRILSPKSLLGKLNDKFKLLKSNQQGLHARQLTLKGAIDWGWDLLADHEKSALAQISIFKGAFPLEAAEEVVDLGSFDKAPMVMDVIQSLKEKSFLNVTEVEELDDEPFFHAYQIIRDYASERLEEMSLREITEKRWAKWLHDYAGSWREEFHYKGSVESQHRLRHVLEGLIHLAQCTDVDVETSASAVVFAYPILKHQGPAHLIEPMITEALGRMGASLAELEAEQSNALPDGNHSEVVEKLILSLADHCLSSDPKRSEVLASHVMKNSDWFVESLTLRANSHFRRSAYQESLKLYGEALRMSRDAGCKNSQAEALCGIGNIQTSNGHHEEAFESFSEALKINKELGNKQGQAININSMGNAAYNKGDFQKSVEYYEEAILMNDEMGNEYQKAASLGNLGLAYNRLEQRSQSLAYHQQALDINLKMGNRFWQAANLGNMGGVYFDLKDFKKTIDYNRQALEINRELGHQSWVAINLEYIGSSIVGYLTEGRNKEAKDLTFQMAHECLTQSMEIKMEIGDRRRLLPETSMALCLWAMGRHEESVEMARSALSHFKTSAEEADRMNLEELQALVGSA